MRLVTSFTILAVAAAGAASAASTDYLLTLPPVKGEAAAARQEIPVRTFGWGKRGAQAASGAASAATVRPAAADGKGTADALTDGLLIMRNTNEPDVAGPGVLVIQGSLPGCAAGKRYAGAQFASATMRYDLKDVVIANCAADGVSLNYGKVTVRGWNPETRQR